MGKTEIAVTGNSTFTAGSEMDNTTFAIDVNTYSRNSRESGIAFNQFLALCDDTRHLCDAVAAPFQSAKFVNIDSDPDAIHNDAEIARLLDGLEEELEAVADATLVDEGGPVRVVKVAPTPEHAQPTSAQIIKFPIAPKQTSVIEVPEPVAAPIAEPSRTQIAPAFRGYAPLPTIKTDADREELMRRRFEDIVFLHRVGHRECVDTSLGDGKFRNMMAGDQLDQCVVREFVDLVSSPKHRMTDEHIAVDMLFVPARLQLQMCQLATDAIKRKRSDLIHKEPAVRAKLKHATSQSGNGKNLNHVPLWARLWVADELIKFVRTGKVEPGSERSPQEIGLLLGAMTGKAMDRGNVRAKLKALDKGLGKSVAS